MNSELGKLLLRSKILDQNSYQNILQKLEQSLPSKNLNTYKTQELSFAVALIQNNYMKDDQLADFLSRATSFPRIVSNMVLNFNDEILSDDISKDIFYRYYCVPFFKAEDIIHVAVIDPLDKTLIKKLEFILGCKVKPFIAKYSQIIKSLDKYFMSNDIDSYLGYGSGVYKDNDDEVTGGEKEVDINTDDFLYEDSDINLDYDVSNLNVLLVKIISSSSFQQAVSLFTDAVRHTVQYCGIFKVVKDDLAQNIFLALEDSEDTSAEEAQSIIYSSSKKLDEEYVKMINLEEWNKINLSGVYKKTFLYLTKDKKENIIACIIVDEKNILFDKIYLNIVSDLLKAVIKKYE